MTISSPRLVTMLAGIAVLSSTVGLLAILGVLASVGVEDVYGPPGSDDYKRYEAFNRVMAAVLGAGASGVAAFAGGNRQRLVHARLVTTLVVAGAWFGMATATAAEFWLFTDDSYAGDTARQLAFTAFSVSELVAMIGLFALGISLLRTADRPHVYAMAFIAYPLVAVGFYASDLSLFLAPVGLTLLLGLTTISGLRLHGREIARDTFPRVR